MNKIKYLLHIFK